MMESAAQLPPLPTLPITSAETLRKCRELSVGKKDIFICSFPKSGTTWMQNIVFQLLSAERMATSASNSNNQNNSNRQTTDELPWEHISQYAPFYEIDPHWEETSDQLVPKIQQAHDALGYRLFNTHLRWDMLPKGEGAKYIYLVRDGRDVLTSFYHHMTNQHPEDGGFEGDFEAFFQGFLDGTVAYGKWSHHLFSWIPHIQNKATSSQILLVRYEDLKQNLSDQVLRIADFLELQNFASAGVGSPIKTRVLERVSFEWMRKHQSFFHPISVRWKPGYNFIRKGSIGDHDSVFHEKHQKMFMETVVEDFGGKDNVPDWFREVCVYC
jgi:hypothetical protein